MATDSFEDEPVTLAAIIGAHGVTGEVRLKLFGDGVESLSKVKSFDVSGSAAKFTLTKVRPDNKGGAIARFAEITDRTAAEKLRSTVLTATRAVLPKLVEGEFYFSDLIGLAVVTDTGEAVGIVHTVENFGATDIVEIKRPDGRLFMVPLTKQAVTDWDSERMVVSADFVEL